MAAMKRRRISYPRGDAGPDSLDANQGHFIVYTTDEKGLEFPLEYLSKSVFRELLRMSEEEFGHPTDGAITLPCDNTFLDYVISLVRSRVPEELEKALLTSIASFRLSASDSFSQ